MNNGPDRAGGPLGLTNLVGGDVERRAGFLDLRQGRFNLLP